MHISKKGLELIKEFEGCKLEAYKCSAGKWTIGFGHTEGVHEGSRLPSVEAALDLLDKDIIPREKQILMSLKRQPTQSQFDAMVSFVFNVGIGNLEAKTGFRGSSLLRLFNEGRIEEAADQFARWNKVKGVISRGLIRRREAERELFLS
jgi:lysozyme